MRAGLLAACGLLAAPPVALAVPADGAALFAQHCAACHQADGSGTVGLAPPLVGGHWARLGADRAYLPMVLVHGLSGPIQLGSVRFVGSMPAFAALLDDAALALLASHVRALQGAKDEAPYSADELRSARQQAGGPPQTRARRLQALGQ